jgi:heptosyltransferase III
MSIDWGNIDRILVIRLRSIGDTVLATPSLIALKRFLPDAKIDILLEDWVAPVLNGFDAVDEILIAGRSAREKLHTLREIRRRRYNLVFNLHGGTTSTFLTYLSGARHRVGYRGYQYSFLYDQSLSSSAEFWGREKTHSAEQQLALLGFVGVPVDDRPLSRISVTTEAMASLDEKLTQLSFDLDGPFAVIHPVAAFDSKRWAMEKFAETVAFLAEKGIKSIAVGSQREAAELQALKSVCSVPVWVSGDIDLPETSALLSRASLFVGNDSGIAHMAAAVKVPSVVIFGSMNRDHWYPWTDAPNEMVFEEFHCQPCAGYTCQEFGEPRCILTVGTDSVFAAISRMLESTGR